MTSDTDTSSSDEMKDDGDLSFWKRRDLEFRILILGRANAGKTTILERLTGTSIDKAEIWQDGKLLDRQIIKGQSDRGLHDINNEIRFPSRPGFVFHDSRGFEAGSSEELSTVQQFVEDRSSAVTRLDKQLHVIWMCLPLDDSRELFETETELFHWSKGNTPLVVIFTKRDGAVSKVMQSKESPSSLDSTVTSSRAFKKQARAQAEIQVTENVKEREEKLRGLNPANSYLAFVTTSDMEEPTAQSAATCMDLIKATKKGLNGPMIKTLLSLVWGRNLSESGYWCFYWVLKSSHKSDIKLSSEAPDELEMIKALVTLMIYNRYDVNLRSIHLHSQFSDLFLALPTQSSHHFGYPLPAIADYDTDIRYLESMLGQFLHMYTQTPGNVKILTLAVLVIILMHAVHTEVLSAVPTARLWISAISSFLEVHYDLVQDRVHTIISQVAAIVAEIKDRNIMRKWLKVNNTWKFSHNKAQMFSGKLNKCVEDNLI